MPAEFESGFFVRTPAWHTLGNVIADYPTIADGLKAAGLGWHATKENVFLADDRVLEGTYAVVRDSDQHVLGVVGEQYRIVQPDEAFAFMDDLIGEGLKLDTAGSLFGGRVIWVLAKAPSRTVLGDEVAEYICFSTSFDGSSKSRANETPTRVVCANTLTMSHLNAIRSWSTRHTGRLEDKLADARRTLKLSSTYMDEFTAKAERFARTKVSADEFKAIVTDCFGDESTMTKKQLENTASLKSQLGIALRRDDLANFKGSAWHLYNAFGDFASHIDPVRKTAEWRDNLWLSFLNGNEVMLKVETALDAIGA
jgi:phage/plasmid-like protein (TIGR03299 family)